MSRTEIDLKITDTPNIERLLEYSDSLDNEDILHPEFYGYEYKHDNLNINEIGTWIDLPDGDKLWRYHIISINTRKLKKGKRSIKTRN